MAQRKLYEEEANAINEIQKGILAISQKEDPFDVFICYKEADDHGRRTPDSVLANELYHQLVQEGFKVFYARITLEDKLGTAYEPYIFAALNSAKVMVVLGTRPEYFRAVWVRNEWSRFLALVRVSGGRKVLIPAYRDMDPYDLPEEFSHLQALDMSRLGFMQDLIRGIKKIIGTNTAKPVIRETVVVPAATTANTNVEPLLRRAFIFLEDSSFAEADEYCERVLDQDPENARAYLGKLMAELHVNKQENLAKLDRPFDDNGNFRKAIRFGDAELVSTLNGYISTINERNEKKRLTDLYNKAVMLMDSARSESAYKAAAEAFKVVSGFMDADAKAAECMKLARDSRLSILYRNATEAMNKASNEAEYKAASEKFRSLAGYKNSAAMAEKCLQLAQNCRNEGIHSQAKAFMAKKTTEGYEQAIRQFQSISGYKDSAEQVVACQEAIDEIKARKERERLEKERRAEEKRVAAEQRKAKAKSAGKKALFAIAGLAILALVAVVLLIVPKRTTDYGEEQQIISEDADSNKLDFSNVNIGDTILFGQYEQDNDLTNGKEYIEWIILDKQDDNILLISKYALDCKPFDDLNNYSPWSICSLRSWLNSEFLNTAFNSEEQSCVLETDQNDKLYLLSDLEAKEYFVSNEARKCRPTAYAVANGAETSKNQENGSEATCLWWLIDPGFNNSDARVLSDGSIYYTDGNRTIDSVAVRPAMRIEIGENDATASTTSADGTIYDGSHKLVELKDAIAGSTVLFGQYEQDNDIPNGKEDIEWLVLDKKDGKLLVISKYALDCRPYRANDSWESCDIRSWLNDKFLNSSFSIEEQALISDVENKSLIENSTTDKVFVLSYDEVKTYFSSDEARICVSTSYAKSQGCYTNANGNCIWVLRGAIYQPGVSCVNQNGAFGYSLQDTIRNDLAVRPALWIEVGSSEETVSTTSADSTIYDGTHELVALKEAEVGDFVLFGKYEQDNDTTNGKEDIEWLVLDKQDGKMLVISKFGLDVKKYNNEPVPSDPCMWKTCSLRKCLNNTFLKESFSSSEMKKIMEVTVKADKNPLLNKTSGKDTKDKVFILSSTETGKYFGSIDERKCQATEYAKAQGCSIYHDNMCWWLLRTYGYGYISIVNPSGEIMDKGSYNTANYIAVRPAMWISIGS